MSPGRRNQPPLKFVALAIVWVQLTTRRRGGEEERRRGEKKEDGDETVMAVALITLNPNECGAVEMNVLLPRRLTVPVGEEEEEARERGAGWRRP